MMSYEYLFDIAIILLSTKLLGLVTKKFKMPQVVGALLAGVVLGPAMLNILHETDFIIQLAEIGVIILMFTAGLETDMKELKKTGKASVVIAIFGVLVPFVGGFIIAYMFNNGDMSGDRMNVFLQNVFIGIILTATSVSITVETLKELGKLNTRAGNAILGAALIDDILGIVALTVVTSVTDSSVNIWWVLAKIVLFFVFAVIVGTLFYKIFNKLDNRYHKDMRRFVIVSFVLCLGLAFIAEEFFGVADITGAFIAGLILSNTDRTSYITARFETMSYMLLSPIFFASIGIKVVLPEMTTSIVILTILLIVVAVFSKIFGCAIGAKVCKFKTREAVQIGTGMVSRGEVALIVASKGMAMGLMSSIFMAPIVVMVIVTTIVTPILLKIVFASNEQSESEESIYKGSEDKCLECGVQKAN